MLAYFHSLRIAAEMTRMYLRLFARCLAVAATLALMVWSLCGCVVPAVVRPLTASDAPAEVVLEPEPGELPWMPYLKGGGGGAFSGVLIGFRLGLLWARKRVMP